MPLQSLEPDELELEASTTNMLPRCPFCGNSVIMTSSVNCDAEFSNGPVYQSRIYCINHRCNASIVCSMPSRKEAQRGAIKQWSSRKS